MPWCLEPRAEGRRRASPPGSSAAAAAASRYGPLSFSALYSLSWRGELARLHRARGGERRGASAAAEADILNSWDMSRIGFHDRVVQSWGDLQVVWQRPRSFSVMDAHRKKNPQLHRSSSLSYHVRALEKREMGAQIQQTKIISVVP